MSAWDFLTLAPFLCMNWPFKMININYNIIFYKFYNIFILYFTYFQFLTNIRLTSFMHMMPHGSYIFVYIKNVEGFLWDYGYFEVLVVASVITPWAPRHKIV